MGMKTRSIIITGILSLVILVTMIGSIPKKKGQNLTDDKLFEREIHNAAIEAAKEFGLNPDSTYIPFREINKGG